MLQIMAECAVSADMLVRELSDFSFFFCFFFTRRPARIYVFFPTLFQVFIDDELKVVEAIGQRSVSRI